MEETTKEILSVRRAAAKAWHAVERTANGSWAITVCQRSARGDSPDIPHAGVIIHNDDDVRGGQILGCSMSALGQ